MSALSTLFYCIARDLHLNFYDGHHRNRYSLSPHVFDWLRMRLATIRCMYFQNCFNHNCIPIWETMMVDHLFFRRQDPIALIATDVLYRDSLVVALQDLRRTPNNPWYADSSSDTDSDPPSSSLY